MTTAEARGGFRPDIEGLRALAVLLVLLYHAGLPPVAGFLGVDVFFVISGFLITGLLLRELDRTGTLDWPAFLARRARRLLPAAVLVLLVTAALAWVVVPGMRRHQVGWDIVGAAAYVVNWVLASRSVDYLASDDLPSPVQHYWSLSVEEQFYVLWPALLLLTVWLLRRRGRRAGPGAFAVVLALVCVPSLVWSVWLALSDPAAAYFPTTTRVWQLGAGAGLAIWHARAGARARRGPEGAPDVRTRAAALALGLAGVGAVLGCAALLPEQAAWPGAWALVPTLGTSAMLHAGWLAPATGVARLLAWRPLVAVGALSYSLYLWHWPVRVLGEWLVTQPLTGPSRGPAPAWVPVALVAASVVPAWLAHRYLEQPIHHGVGRLGRAWRAGAGAGAGPALRRGAVLSLAGVAGGLTLLLATSPFSGPPAGRLPELRTLGAATLGPTPPTAPAPPPAAGEWVVPDPLEPGLDRPRADVDHCQVPATSTTAVRCDFGDPRGAHVVALVGDSTAMQWLPALEQGARERGWRIVTYGKSACAFAAAPAVRDGEPYPQCDAWDAAVVRELQALRPDVVVTSVRAREALDDSGQPSTPALAAGLGDRWRALQAQGARVVVVGANPGSPDDLDGCAARNPRDLPVCTYPLGPALERTSHGLTGEVAASVPGVRQVDLTPWICPAGSCPVVIGHVTVHRAGDHITATYAATLALRLVPEVERALAQPERGRTPAAPADGHALGPPAAPFWG